MLSDLVRSWVCCDSHFIYSLGKAEIRRVWVDQHLFVHSFIYSGHFYSASSSPLLLRGAPDYSTDTVSEFHAEGHRQTAGKGLAQGPSVAARAGVEPTTLRLSHRLNKCATMSHDNI